MEKYKRLLMRLGMSDEEISVYLVLLEHPHITISDIAKYTGTYRPAVYRSIWALMDAGYVERSLLEGRRYYYHAAHPEKLREKVRELAETASRLLPELGLIYEKRHTTPSLSLHEGIDAIRELHIDIVNSLPHGSEYSIYTSLESSSPKRALALSEKYKKIQREKELSRHIISSDTREGWEKKDPYEEITLLPKSNTPLDGSMTKIIAWDTVTMIDHESTFAWQIRHHWFARYEEQIFRVIEQLQKRPK